MYEIRHYLTNYGEDIYLRWWRMLRDQIAKVAIDRRVSRIELGSFGDHKFCRDGVWELRINVGAGYRVYYAFAANAVVLLLGGGDKGSQRADIQQACENWRDWQKRGEQ